MNPLGNFHHIGLACTSLDAELKLLAPFGYSADGPVIEDQIQKVRVQFITGAGPRIELIEPTSKDSPVQGVLKRGNKLYHLAYETPQFDQAVAFLEGMQFRAIGPSAPAIAFGMRRIIFMMSATLSLVELIEASR